MIKKNLSFCKFCLYYTKTVVFVLFYYILCTLTSKNYEMWLKKGYNNGMNNEFSVNSRYIILQIIYHINSTR